jgi:hypothetical protein
LKGFNMPVIICLRELFHIRGINFTGPVIQEDR